MHWVYWVHWVVVVMSFGSDVVEGDDDDGFGGWVEAFGDGSSLGPIGFKKISQAKRVL